MKKTVAIIGGGPSAFAAAAFLDSGLFDVTIYEKNKTVGRKFLVAGKGGFNLTHSEPIDQLISRYSESSVLEDALKSFTNDDLRAWLDEIGVPTYIGSSKRIYPEKGIKPIEVLTKLLDVLKSNSVRIEFEKEWNGWSDEGKLKFTSEETIAPDITIFSLGGGSWKVTGSDGSWIDHFEKRGIKTIPFLPSNCAYSINWDSELIEKIEGMPLKNIALRSENKVCTGEVVITKFGMEGNAIYALSPEIQAQLSHSGSATIYLDLKPSFTEEQVLTKLCDSSLKTTDILRRKLNLSKTQINLLKSSLTKEEFLSKLQLSEKIKHFPLQIESAAPLDEAISTTGGISMDSITSNFELKERSNVYCIGEMLDWNAPTGGYLLQACFSIGVFVAKQLNSVSKD
ncbi:MAG: aminoacetone oxidase family FAD-binding enzyme [Fluviicola sp.]|nr:MAG: aminoacetone oxidase family FAD-binding enzyme [Fluviicola sp.]